jgi:hypothetical protein
VIGAAGHLRPGICEATPFSRTWPAYPFDESVPRRDSPNGDRRSRGEQNGAMIAGASGKFTA